MDDLKRISSRGLVDRAIVHLSEIERRMGRGSEVTEVIARLLKFGRQFDGIGCVNCGVTYDTHRMGGSGTQCSEFREPDFAAGPSTSGRLRKSS